MDGTGERKMFNRLIEKLEEKDDFYSAIKLLLPQPKYWPKKLHEIRLDRYYYAQFGKHIDFNYPQTFNEKINWYMVNYNDTKVTEVTDKVSFKEYVKSKIGSEYIAKLYGVWGNINDVDFTNIPLPFVLKSNCSGDGSNIEIISNKGQINESLMSKLRGWLHWQNTFINSSSNAYFRIKPQILAEEFLFGQGDKLIDYKLYCFDGEPYCAYTSVDHFKSEGMFSFYDMDWNVMNVKYLDFETMPVEKPIHFEEMKRLASILSRGFPFMRVDFYETTAGLKVGEMTYDSSFGLKPFEPEEFDYELGRKFVLPTDK